MFPPEAFRFPLVEIAGILRAHEVRFALTGGLISAFYSEPRFTQDADLVVSRDDLLAVLPAVITDLVNAGFLLSPDVLDAAVQNGRAFQLLHKKEILKIDIYPRELVPGQLDRAVNVEMFSGVMLPILSRSDLAISKLVWISKGSHKSRRDLRQICRRSSDEEMRQIRTLSVDLSLEPLLQEVLAERDEIDA